MTESNSTVAPAPKKPARNPSAARAFHDESALGKAYDTQLLARVWPYVRPYRAAFFLSLALLPIVSELLVRQPQAIRSAIDGGILHGDEHALNRAVGLFSMLLLAEFGTRFVQTYVMQYVGQQVMAGLRADGFSFLIRQRLAYFDRQPVGRLVTRVTNDVDALGELFASGAVTAVGDLFTLVRIVIAMMALSPSLSLYAFVAVPPLAYLVDRFRRNAREAFREIRTKTAALNSYLNEQVNGAAVVQAFGQQERCQRDFGAINESYRRANYASIRYDALLFAVVEMFSSVCVATLLFVGARSAGLGEPAASLGTLVAFVQYIQRFFEPMRDLSGKFTILQSAMAGAERIFQMLDTDEPDAPVTAADTTPSGTDAIAFDHVSFSYGPDRPVLRDVSFRVTPGQTVALVGATGAGKTTVLSLLQRWYEATDGSVRVNGVDIRAMSIGALRTRFAVVSQDGYLFPGDILTNIALGIDVPDVARAERCASAVGLDQLLARRGAGLATVVQERGQNFSAGERQLVSLARALYRDPEILLLDEATSSVDSESESVVQQAIATTLAGRTSIVVAHRLSTIRHADQILVFHRGQIVERGTHGELLAAGGVYARLHRLQLGADDAAA